MFLRVISLFGLFCMVALAWLLSESRWRVNWRLAIWGLGLQLFVGICFFWTPLEGPIFMAMQKVVDVLTDSTLEGASFVFGELPKEVPLAFQVLPVIIFVSALSAILYHLRVIQATVRGLSWLMRRTMKTSGAETLTAALLIFMGIESVTAVRGYLLRMTRSELCTVMTTFMATIAGSVMVVYANFGAKAGHLLAASLMSAPAAIVISKVLVPETEEPETAGEKPVHVEITSHNIADAATQGTADGLRMALQVGATLIVFIGLVYLLNLFLEAVLGFTFQSLMGWIFRPFAFLLGTPWKDIGHVSELLGTKTVLNEFLGYTALRDKIAEGVMSPRAVTISTYALCGFANPGSIGIMIAGIDALIPGRRAEVTQLSLRAFVGGALACFMTACVAGFLIYE